MGGLDGDRVRFAESSPGCFTATLRSAGAYVLSATFGGQLASGWPQPVEVVPACSGPIRMSIKGDALQGVTCGRASTLTLSTADMFGNPRCARRAMLLSSYAPEARPALAFLGVGSYLAGVALIRD